MARYCIRTWHDDTIVKWDEMYRATRPSAFRAYRLACYDVLKAFAKLDTPAAYTVMAECFKHDDILPIGESRSILVSNTGYRVTITREA